MDRKRLIAAYDRLKSGVEVNVRELYKNSYLDDALPERAIEVSEQDLDELLQLNGMAVNISYTRFGKKRPDRECTLCLGVLYYVKIDDRCFVSFPDDVWGLEMALMDHYIMWLGVDERLTSAT